jgi:hypothetical protein
MNTDFIYSYIQSVFIRVNPCPIPRRSKCYLVTLLSILMDKDQ